MMNKWKEFDDIQTPEDWKKITYTQKKKLALRHGTEIGCSSEPPGIRRAIVMRKNEEEPLWSEKKRSAAPIG